MKYLLYFIIVLVAFSCSVNESDSENKKPSDFEVYVNSTTYNKVELSWSESFDPEKEQITYSIYLGDILIESNVSTRFYNFENLVPSVNYTGKVVAYDASGNDTSKNFTFTTNGNLAPIAFNIISIAPDNVSANVFWSKALDPENQEVLYSIYLNNQLIIKDYTFENFRFENLSANMSYNGRIVAKDPTGKETFLDFVITTADGIYHGDVSFRSQQSVTNFGAKGYVEITGDFEMSGFAGTSDISDLSPLKTIKKVNGYLDINFCNNLTTLSGLEIEYIGKSFRIKQNRALLNLNGLGNLKQVLGNFEIYQNSALQIIEGLDKLTTIGAILSIDNNVGLLRIKGFNNVNLVDYIFISANWPLLEINGFNNIVELEGDLSIVNNTSLITCLGFEKMQRIGRLYIENSLLQNINMLSTLQTVDGDVSIQANAELANISGFISLINIVYGSLIINKNIKLTSLNGLQNLKTIGNTLQINYNSSLSDFCALQNTMQNFVPKSRESIYSNLINPSIAQIKNGSCN